MEKRPFCGRSIISRLCAFLLAMLACGLPAFSGPAPRAMALRTLADKKGANSGQEKLGSIAMDERYDLAVRMAAVNRLTDQALLTAVAITPSAIYSVDFYQHRQLLVLPDGTSVDLSVKAEDRFSCASTFWQCIVDAIRQQDSLVRAAAVEKLPDPALLTKIALTTVWSEVGDVPRKATERLADQSELARIALEAKDEYARNTATRRLGGQDQQSVLVRIALNASEDYAIRDGAIEKLTDQAVLAQIATNVANDRNVRDAAERRLTDEPALEKIAQENDLQNAAGWAYWYGSRRKDAIQRISDQSVLLRIARDQDAGPYFRAVAAASLSDDAPLRALAEDQSLDVKSPIRLMARLKLATLDPRIRARLPQFRAVFKVVLVSQSYYGIPGGHGELVGERIEFSLTHSGDELEKKSWEPKFPGSMPAGSHQVDPIEPSVDITGPIAVVLQNPIFTQDDLVQLATSPLSEVRDAAEIARKTRFP